MFDNKLNGVINYFDSRTSDLLFLFNLAQESGATGAPGRVYSNFGDLSSKGLEIDCWLELKLWRGQNT